MLLSGTGAGILPEGGVWPTRHADLPQCGMGGWEVLDRAARGCTNRPPLAAQHREEAAMPESVYKVIEIVGTSSESWEKATRTAVERASKSLRDLRIAEVIEQDVVIEDGKVTAYRTKLKLSFKYEG